MTKEEFKDTVLNILLHAEAIDNWMMFDTDDISHYKIAQYDEDEWDVEAAMPLDDFLNDMYDAIMREEDNR